MTLFDRYLLRTFLRVLLVSFISLTGLYIIIDLFGNLEELLAYAEREGSLLQVVASYYGARVLSFFDRTSGLLALLAAIFTITWFQRSNELTAVMAAGIPKCRIVRPLIAASVAVAVLAAANRELGLPPVRDKLGRNAQDWLGERAQRLTPRRDNRTRILIAGRATVAAGRQIVQPSFRLPAAFAPFGRQLVAREASYQPAGPEHPGGYRLDGVTQPANIADLPTGYADDQPVILTPRDHSWLAPDQCFVVSDVTFEHLGSDAAWRQYASTKELLGAVRNPSLDYGADTRVELHRRFVQPLLDVTLLFLGLPLVLARSSRNLFVAAAQCLLLMLAFVVVVLTCQTIGNTVLVSPALAAWLPLMVFVPPAYVAAARRWE
ncbi:MAG: LptF/LptG family permease [Pirellulaceae bacterium]|jgi:lipopolysaccharide export system permease protein|nr:LptF/LptG family permease [Pirellulaceae bacterium]